MKLFTGFILMVMVAVAATSSKVQAEDAIPDTTSETSVAVNDVPKSMTAESALPQRHEEGQAKQAAMDDAVKMAIANLHSGLPTDEKSIALVDTAKTAGAEKLPSENGVAAEASQPLFTNAAAPVVQKALSPKALWGRMLGSIAIVLVLFGGGLYAFKRWPGSKKITSRAKMIEIISQHYLGPKKSLAVVRVAGETCLIGITDNNISILKTLALLDDDIPKDALNSVIKAVSASVKSPGSETLGQKFQKTLADKFSKTPENTPQASYTRAGTVAVSKPEGEEEFSMQGLRDIVGQKLKTMKEF